MNSKIYEIKTIKQLLDLVDIVNIENLCADLVLALYSHLELKTRYPDISIDNINWCDDNVKKSTSIIPLAEGQGSSNTEYKIVMTTEIHKK